MSRSQIHNREPSQVEINDFGSLLEARVIIGDWRHAYNHDRPHSSLLQQQQYVKPGQNGGHIL